MYKHWYVSPDQAGFSGCTETADKLKAGLYAGCTAMNGAPVCTPLQPRLDKFCFFDHGPMRSVIKEIDCFWRSKQKYLDRGVTHKRSLLLHGPSGCGKTGIVQGMIEYMTQRDGLSFVADNLVETSHCLAGLRQIEPERPVMVIGEDVDRFFDYAGEEILNLLDGAATMGHGLLFLLTTNHLRKIPVRMRCRQSRVDTLIEIGLPDAELRREYLQLLCPEATRTGELDGWAERTDGLPLSSLKELVLAIKVYEHSLDETIDRLKQVAADEIGSPDEDEETDDNS